MATKSIPVIEPWHRNAWSEVEAIAMLNLKGKPDDWARIKQFADVLPGGNYKGDQLVRIANKLLDVNRKIDRQLAGLHIESGQ